MMRLLCVNLNYLGDALFTTPALAALRARFPGAQMDVLAGERAAAILEGDPSIDRLIVRPPHGGSGRAVALDRTLRAGNYDAVILFQSTLASALLTWAARVPIRVGFAQEGCAPLLTAVVAPRQSGEHDVDAYLRLAQAVPDTLNEVASALPPSSLVLPLPRLSVALSDDDRAFAEQFFVRHELVPPVVGLVIGATRAQKRWPEAHFARLAAKLWNVAGMSAVMLGGPDERDAAQRILTLAAGMGTPLISAVGQTTEKQLAALIARLRIVVSGDSGPLHIATAMSTPVVALFGSTDPADTGPWHPPDRADAAAPAMAVLYDALHCAPCRKTPTCDGRFDCMHLLTPERVFDAVTELTDLPTRRRVLPVVGDLSPEFLAPGSLSPRPPSQPVVPPSLGRGSSGSVNTGSAFSTKQVLPLPREGGTTGWEGGRGDRDPSLSVPRRPRTIAGRPVRSVLILTKHRFMGDTIVAVPLLRATREIFPDAHIALLTGNEAATALQNCPYGITLLPNDPKTKARSASASARLSMSLLQRMSSLRWHDRPDLCLVADRSFRAAAAARLCGGRVRAGFDTEGRGWLLTHPVPYQSDHAETESCLDILRAVAPELPDELPYDPRPVLWPTDAERARGASILAQRGLFPEQARESPLVGMQPGASTGDRKQWPPERFAAVGRVLVARGATLVLLGYGDEEKEAARRMRAAMGADVASKVVDLTGETALRETMGVLTHLSIFVGNDTGVSHIAASVGTPTVTLFGPTPALKWGNTGPHNAVIIAPDGCMDSIPVAPVECAALDLLFRGAAR